MKAQLGGAALVSIALLAVVLACEQRDPPSGPAVKASSESSAQLSGAASAAREEERACTNARLRGSYGFYRTGTTAAGPFAAVGLATYDGAGNWSATQTVGRGGAFTRDATSAGQYEVSADCSGKLFAAGQEVARFALADRGKQLFTLSTSPGETVRGVEKKVGQRGCTTASLDGTYGFFRAGTTPAGPLAAVGIATYDGAGNSAATQTISRNGTIVPGGQPAAYEVGADCTGRLIAANGQEFARMVVVERGTEIYQISLTAGNAVTGVQRKVARGHDERDDD